MRNRAQYSESKGLTMETLRGGEIVGACLKNEGVKVVFGLTGHGNIGIIDGILKYGIQFIGFRHEVAAGMAADGYWKYCHKPAVVTLTCSPGAFNMSLAVTAAAVDCSTIVYIVGDTPTLFAGKTCYEEFDLLASDDQFAVIRPMFKRAWKIGDGQLHLLPEILASAFNVALSGRPGPVLIDIPFDLHKKKGDISLVEMKKRRPSVRPQGDALLIDHATELLAGAMRPSILAGGGVKLAEASHEILELSELLSAPVATTTAGIGTMPETHPNSAGFIGTYGRPCTNKAMNEADVLLAVGTKFGEGETSVWQSEYVFQIPPTRLVQIDIEPREIGKNYPVDVGIVGDAKSSVRLIIEKLKTKELANRPDVAAERLLELARAKAEFREALVPFMESEEVPLDPRRIIWELEKRFSDDCTLLADPSWCRIGIMQQFAITHPQMYFPVGGLLPIGWAAEAAVGVSIGKGRGKVIAVTGDGGFLMGLQSIPSAVEHGLPIVWIVLDNSSYNAIAVLQKAYFGDREAGSHFKIESTGETYSPDYAMIAKGFGAKGERVVRPEEIGPALDRAIASSEPYVLDFVTSRSASRHKRSGRISWEYLWGEDRD